MAKLIDELALSRTFKVVGGQLTIEGISMPPVQPASGQTAGTHSARLVGSTIDSKYQVMALLGEGGMGSVYRVVHLLLKKEMALKTFRTAQPSPEAWSRFQIEAKAIGKLRHGNIVQVFDFGIGEQNFPYYTMELLSGESLADRIAEKSKLEINEALSIFIPVAAGLAHAHRQGIVHRDIKPANIFLEQVRGPGQGEDEPKIVDFGLAKIAEFQTLDDQSMTAKGLVFGSPLYMSPEQAQGLQTDRRTDIYSFGCSLFQTLSGAPPFVGDNFLATILMHQHKKAPTLRSLVGDVIFPARLEAIVAKLLEKDLDDRYQSFEEVGRDLMDFVDSRRQIETSAADDTVNKSHSVSGTKNSVNLEAVDSANGGVPVGAADRGSPLSEPTETKSFSDNYIKFLSIFVLVITLFVAGWALSLGIHWGDKKAPDGVQRWPAEPETATVKDAHLSTKELKLPRAESDVDEALNKLGLDSRDQSASAKGAGKQSVNQLLAPLPVAFCHPGPQGSRIFSFPSIGLSYGEISAENISTRAAIGDITVPRGDEVRFTAGEAFYKKPELFKAFKPEDLTTLLMDPSWKWEERHFAQIVRLSGVKNLIVHSLNLTAPDLQDIGRMPNLKILHVSKASLPTADLSRLPNLLTLHRLFLNDIAGTGPVLEKLRSSRSLEILEANRCRLRDNDLEKIGVISQLGQLCIDSNDLTAEGVKKLAGLHGLMVLRVADNRVGPEVIDTLRQLKKLKELSIETSSWTEKDRESLRQALPSNCNIHD